MQQIEQKCQHCLLIPIMQNYLRTSRTSTVEHKALSNKKTCEELFFVAVFSTYANCKNEQNFSFSFQLLTFKSFSRQGKHVDRQSLFACGLLVLQFAIWTFMKKTPPTTDCYIFCQLHNQFMPVFHNRSIIAIFM